MPTRRQTATAAWQAKPKPDLSQRANKPRSAEHPSSSKTYSYICKHAHLYRLGKSLPNHIIWPYICWHSGSPSHSQGILRFRRPRSLSNMLRIILHYGTNQRGPTIKVPLAVANHWPIMHINSRAGWKQSGLQEHRRLVRLEASYQSQFLVWPRRRRSQSNNQTSTLIFCYNHYLKKMNIMKRSLSWSHWPGFHWNGSTPIKSELCGFPSTCLQVRKIFPIIHS